MAKTILRVDRKTGLKLYAETVVKAGGADTAFSFSHEAIKFRDLQPAQTGADPLAWLKAFDRIVDRLAKTA
jgi:hypothetical protein